MDKLLRYGRSVKRSNRLGATIWYCVRLARWSSAKALILVQFQSVPPKPCRCGEMVSLRSPKPQFEVRILTPMQPGEIAQLVRAQDSYP
jgi:hypothetical protein